MKHWKLAESVPEEAFEVLGKFPRFVASLLWRRGVRTEEDAERFLRPDWERDVYDPFLFSEMPKAVGRIMDAIKAKEKIAVYGDYDADGISGSVVLYDTLKAAGAEVEVYLPHREKEGYGLNSEAIEKLAAGSCKVLITTDCGISSPKEVEEAVQKGIDVIITDHHGLPEELPPAYATLHPLKEGETYPFKELTGGGVAFKLCQALWKEAGLPENQDKWLLDMVSIATVADLGKLVGENRALVHYGLVVMNKCRRKGLSKLIELARLRDRKLNAGTIGFQIAPRINAAGRMDHAQRAFDLLTTDSDEVADRGAELLDKLNRDRRALTEKVLGEARQKVDPNDGEAATVVAGDGWPAALCGLVASRLVSKHHRPTIIFGRDGSGKYVGSGRSVPGFHITAASKQAGEYLEKCGGHPMACGMTVSGDENFKLFKARFLELAIRELGEEKSVPTIEIEEELDLGDVHLRSIDQLLGLEPFGEGNPRPKFLLKQVRIASAQAVGNEGAHLKMAVVDSRGGHLQLIGFHFGSRAKEFQPGVTADIVVELEMNEWRGRREPQGRIVDLQLVPERVPA